MARMFLITTALFFMHASSCLANEKWSFTEEFAPSTNSIHQLAVLLSPGGSKIKLICYKDAKNSGKWAMLGVIQVMKSIITSAKLIELKFRDDHGETLTIHVGVQQQNIFISNNGTILLTAAFVEGDAVNIELLFNDKETKPITFGKIDNLANRSKFVSFAVGCLNRIDS